MRPRLERNIKMYLGRARGVSLKAIADYECITPQRAYQIIAATEYQLANGNTDYWHEYKRQNESY